MTRVISSVLLGLLLICGRGGRAAAQQPGQWEVYRLPSPIDPIDGETNSWFPTLVVDSRDRVHLFWNETNGQAMGTDRDSMAEKLFYTTGPGQEWLEPNDIVPPQADILRHSVAIDRFNILHLLFDRSGGDLYYIQAPVDQAFSAGSWSLPRLLNTRNGTYFSDIGLDNAIIHVIYDDSGFNEAEVPTAQRCNHCSDIFYRRSLDRGQSWSEPKPLLLTDHIGSSRPQLEVDRKGRIYVAWDEGWDRLSDESTETTYGLFIYSEDDGQSWSEPVKVWYPRLTNAHLTVGADGRGGVLLAWRNSGDNATDYPGIYYMWSTNMGQSWSMPRAIPGIIARGWGSSGKFQRYDMATDSAGVIHLLAVGHTPPRRSGEPPQLYHLKWNGQKWSSPTQIYQTEWHPEYPRLVIHRGNQLHATWYERSDENAEVEPRRVWYGRATTQAPPLAVIAHKPTATPTPIALKFATPLPLPSRTPTLTPLPLSSTTPIPGWTFYASRREWDEVSYLIISSSPAALILVVIILIWRRHR